MWGLAQDRPVHLRGQHFLCLLTDMGGDLTSDQQAVFDRAHGGQAIEIVAGIDDLCLHGLCIHGGRCHTSPATHRDNKALSAISAVLNVRVDARTIFWLPDVVSVLRLAFVENKTHLHYDQVTCPGMRTQFRKACEGCARYHRCTDIAMKWMQGHTAEVTI